MDHPGSPIAVDAVITWVDGGDPAHQQKLQALLGDRRQQFAAADRTRFGDCGEIDYCVASLLRFAPWLRTIHIVSDQQRPALMAVLRDSPYRERVRVVDHREIFAGFEQHLPTFSNRSIEAMLWRIPGLAERFLYLNDDFALIRPVAIGDFFTADGVVLRGHWRGTGPRRWSQRLKALAGSLLRGSRPPGAVARPGNHVAQEMSARMAGYADRFFQVPHCPHPVRQSTVAGYFSGHPQALAEVVGYRLRSAEQFLTVSLANHLELKAGTASIDNRLAPLRLKPSSQGVASLRKQIQSADGDARMAFACVQSLDEADEPVRRLLFDWLDRRIGQPAHWLRQPPALSTDPPDPRRWTSEPFAPT